ncbi:MAG TPA: hypothetical protein VHI99_20865 [Vicinamibacterales bacterium]|nr:hypothetical protein [Vicinamibacterales bacterium]
MQTTTPGQAIRVTPRVVAAGRPRALTPLAVTVCMALLAFGSVSTAEEPAAQDRPDRPLTLARLVDPTTRVEVNGRLVQLALHGLIRFDTLADLFTYIDEQSGRWTFATAQERQAFGDNLLQRGVESRVVSMQTELPLEIVLTHTRSEVGAAVDALHSADPALVFRGRHWQASVQTYREAFLRVRDRWSTSLNCWSASSSIAGRVLSNWYLIDEGIALYGATYDSTEHFWQAVKYRPDVTIRQLRDLLAGLGRADSTMWLAALERDEAFAKANAYALTFLRFNLQPDRLASFDHDLQSAGQPAEPARHAQQRVGRGPGEGVRFTAMQEKVLWGDLADVFHLIVSFSSRLGGALAPDMAAVRDAMVAQGFGTITLDGYAGGRFPFLSSTFQDLMFEIWKVKYLQIPRFGEVIRSTVGRRLDHFLDDGDSPDIPIPIYVNQLNRIRDLALAQPKK